MTASEAYLIGIDTSLRANIDRRTHSGDHYTAGLAV
jgi:hypothetical protein